MTLMEVHLRHEIQLLRPQSSELVVNSCVDAKLSAEKEDLQACTFSTNLPNPQAA